MITLKDPIYLCDYCKRTLEHIYMQFKKESSRPILFHGKFMDGQNCMPYKENKNVCLTELIDAMAKSEGK